MFNFSFLSSQQAWLWCLRTIPQASDGLGMTMASSPDLAHKMDSPRHVGPLPLNMCMTVFVSNHLLYKSTLPLNIVLFSDLDEELCVCSVMCRGTSQSTGVSKNILGPLQTSCIFARLRSDLPNIDFKEWQPQILFIYFSPPAPSGHVPEPKSTPQTALNYQLDC